MLELSNEADIPCSSITINVFKTVTGYLPLWDLNIMDDIEMIELLALRDGIELARAQFDKLMDLMLSEE